VNRVPPLPVSAVALVAALVFAGGAPARTVAPTGGSTPVREYAGTIAFSQFDQATSSWYLTVRRAGATEVERLPIPQSTTPFEADIGPDSEGRPELIYQRCSGTRAEPTGCDLFVFSLAGGTGERPVRNANDPAHNDVAATLWRGRIAWTRVYGTRENPDPVVYTKALTASQSRPSTRLRGVPRRRCGDVFEHQCGPTTGRSVQALELRGRKLALTVRYTCRGCSGILQTELRLNDVRNRSSRQIAFQVVGLSGQALIGPSFFAGRLAWYKACLVEPSGCRRGGPFRYTLSTRRYQKGARGPVRVDGFADAGSRLYEVLCSGETQSPAPEDCRVHEAAPSRYAATRPPLR
jgi:hypothetical protein